MKLLMKAERKEEYRVKQICKCSMTTLSYLPELFVFRREVSDRADVRKEQCEEDMKEELDFLMNI